MNNNMIHMLLSFQSRCRTNHIQSKNKMTPCQLNHNDYYT